MDFSQRLPGEHHFGYRVNASHQEGNSVAGTGVKRDAIAVSLDADLTSNLRWNMDAIYQKMTMDQPTPMAFLSKYTSSELPHIGNSDKNPQADNACDDTKFREVNTGLYWQINDNWELRADVAESRNQTVFSMGYLYLLDPSGRYRDSSYDGDYIYQYKLARTLLQGSFDLGPTEHNLIIGANYQSGDTQLGYSNLTRGYVAHGYRTLGDNEKLVYTPTYGWSQPTYPTSGDRQRAVFVSDTVTFSPSWSALAGVRYTQYNQYSNTYQFVSQTSYTKTKTNYTAYNLSPTVALMYTPFEAATAYASYVEALESGATVGATYGNYGQQLNPVKSKQYEVGFKVEKGLINGGIALFRLDRGNGYANSANYYVQDGKSHPLPGHGPDSRYNMISVSRMGPHDFQLLKMKGDDVVVGEFWTFSPDGRHLVRKGVGKSTEGKSKAFVEYFDRVE